jgi:hypothetical protein
MDIILGDLWQNFSHVETSLDINFFIVFSIFVLINIGYHIFDWYLQSHYTGVYGDLPFHRKRYIIKNILKAYYLGITSVYLSIMVGTFVWTGVWSTYQIHNLGLIYMMPDLVSLVRVPKLDINTVQHHLSVTVLACLNLFCDYSIDTYWRGMVIYGYMSALTGIVNFYLGYRLLTHDLVKKRKIAYIAYITYLVSIIINWSYQSFVICTWLFTSFPLWGLYAYILIMYFIVKDDIILLSFLHYAMTPPQPAATTELSTEIPETPENTENPILVQNSE